MTPQIELFGLILTEPMTVFTDYLIAAASFFFAARLIFSEDSRRRSSHRLWGLAFLVIGVGALLGGTSHGFANYLSDGTANLIWTSTLYTIGLSMFLAVAGTIRGSVPNRRWQKIFNGLSTGVFLTYAVWIMNYSGFLSAIIITVFSFGCVALMQTWSFLQRKVRSAKWLIAGVAVSFIGAAIQRFGPDLHANFNHNDLYHVVQLIGLYLLYRGADLLDEQKPGAAL